ncbi:MAG: GNAT family N-acetyltransferase [Lachnospiraceae bacterium]|nr:GNAT family N-acetyltransferase [Lachnospiraceae bacterium]
MVYYKDDELIIRSMEEADDKEFYEALTAQGWHPQTGDWLKRMKEETEGKCITLTAVYQEQAAGYVYLYKTVNEGPFRGKGWPMIVDFNVLKKFQRKGIGNRLMDAAERLAVVYADTVCLGVGVCDSYGSAQRMYVKRGYIPDGSGVWYQDKQCVQYETVCTVDDDLIMYLYKKLKDN